MKSWVIERLGVITPGSAPLSCIEMPLPQPAAGEVRLRVQACGICHTELDEIEGRTPPPQLPVIPGHQVVGVVDALGPGCTQRRAGERVGVAWIHSACGHCPACVRGQENLCAQFLATGRDCNGGYAEYMTTPEAFTCLIPPPFTAVQAAPLLCAGAVGYRSLHLANLHDGERLGLTGFGASAHLVLQMARYLYPHSPVHVFARNAEERAFALQLGACWAGDTQDAPPQPLDAIIDTTPAWTPIVQAMACLAPGGRLVINAIRKEPADQASLLGLQYEKHLWLEKSLRSVANVTREDVNGFLQLAARMGLQPETETYDFAEANRALLDLKFRRVRGAKVLLVNPS